MNPLNANHGGGRPDATAGVDFITIIQSPARRLAKLIHPGGTVDGYDEAKLFDLNEVCIPDFEALIVELKRLHRRQDRAIVRGRIADLARTHRVRRLCLPDQSTGDAPTLIEAPHMWLALDLDDVPRPDGVPAADLDGCAHAAIDLLPVEFQGVRCLAAATGSHGLRSGSRLRLLYWLDRPVTGPELKSWLFDAPVDLSLFSPAQVCYTSGPVFAPGAVDHLPHRGLVLPGRPEVRVPPADVHVSPPYAAPKPCRSGTSNDHITAILRNALIRVRDVSPGGRNNELFASGFTIGGLLNAAGIEETDAERVFARDYPHFCV